MSEAVAGWGTIVEEDTVKVVAGMVYVPGLGKTVTVFTGKVATGEEEGEVEEEGDGEGGAGAGEEEEGAWTTTVL